MVVAVRPDVPVEVLVFLWLGPRLVARIGPARSLMLAALAGVLRWAVQAQTAWLPALFAIQALHGVLPVGAGADALSAAVLPGLGSLAVPLAIVIGWGAAALVATVVSMGRRQTFTTDELRAAVA